MYFFSGHRYSQKAQKKWKEKIEELMIEMRQESRMEITMDIPGEFMALSVIYEDYQNSFQDDFDFSDW